MLAWIVFAIFIIHLIFDYSSYGYPFYLITNSVDPYQAVLRKCLTRTGTLCCWVCFLESLSLQTWKESLQSSAKGNSKSYTKKKGKPMFTPRTGAIYLFIFIFYFLFFIFFFFYLFIYLSVYSSSFLT